MAETIKAIVKWPGGKISEAEKILPILPRYKGRFIDPFVGGGSIYFASQAQNAAINDRSEELIALYIYIQQGEKKFFQTIHRLDDIRRSLCNMIEGDTDDFLAWFNSYILGNISKEELNTQVKSWVKNHESKLSEFTFEQIETSVFYNEIFKNLTRKLFRMQKLSEENGGLKDTDIIDNFETAFHSAFYMYVRHLYNYASDLELSHSLTIATFYYIREFCYSSMFRYNNDGIFNVPYGGMAYNSKNFFSKISRLQKPIYQEYLRHTEIHNRDFSEFFKVISPNVDDFIFLDPPYDSDFSTYDGNSFDKEDHERLASFMTKTKSNFMMVIKNTDFIMNLYSNIPGVKTQIFDKKYMVSFQNRNEKRAKHLIITNYSIPKPTAPQLF
ncbi:MAG: DNA adenine methylase [Anaerolineales bacterium]|uniref:site-specific DNA-methyltransferase (adenine-specific) n=1 Tax=Candidatus Desulfolinea nitratireducens TaxID=2841698 RepID=A0A8J6NER9_9CHLR|nr:DNA adenine methylase [Candidatus Desulfolinea nitratireducens]MBL6961111.1 DNA adenine methylase [Anaerolineales bacterium]